MSFSVLFSAIGTVLYLFGGSNYPESEECLDGLYAYDIGKAYKQLTAVALSASRSTINLPSWLPFFVPLYIK